MRAVRRAFDDTVRPHCDEANSLLEAVRDELTDSLAAALVPHTAATLTPTLRQAIDDDAEVRRREVELALAGLEDEADALAEAAAVVDPLVEWIADADETPLSKLDFDDQRERHETLATYRARCATLVAERQAVLSEVTSDEGVLALRHRALVSNLYEDFTVDHPILATVVRLDGACADCQRALQDHLDCRV